MKTKYVIDFKTESKEVIDKYKAELFIHDDRFQDDLVDIYNLKENVEIKDKVCPRCGSISNVYLDEYYDNNGVIGHISVCPYCINLRNSEFNTEEKIVEHFEYIKQLILDNRK